jgi:hypothetical protein
MIGGAVNKREARCASPSAILKPDQFNQEYLENNNAAEIIALINSVLFTGKKEMLHVG